MSRWQSLRDRINGLIAPVSPEPTAEPAGGLAAPIYPEVNTAPADPIERAGRTRRPWTFMVYMAGDNGRVFDTELGKVKLMADMTTAGYRDLVEMGTVGTTPNVAVTCLFDTSNATYLIEVRQGTGFAGSNVRRLREVNTGSPETLSQFVIESTRLYPADHYALVIWNHGTGWLDVDAYQMVRRQGKFPRIFRGAPKEAADEETRPIAYDDTSLDFLDARDLRRALGEVKRELGRKLDVIGMDACLMAMIEGARELEPFADYFVASQEVEPMDGWPYAGILRWLDRQPTAPPAQLAEVIVREFARAYSGESRNEETVTQSAIDLSRTGETEYLCRELVNAVLRQRDDPLLRTLARGARAQSLVFEDRNYRDLGDFAARIAGATEFEPYPKVNAAARVLRAHMDPKRSDSPVLGLAFRDHYESATGLSVYLPDALAPDHRREQALRVYRDLGFAKVTGWDRLLGWLEDESWQRLNPPEREDGNSFRRELAPQTLDQFLDMLIDEWSTLLPGLRDRLAQIIRNHGQSIGNYRESDRHNVAERLLELLNAFWALYEMLPPTLLDALRQGRAEGEAEGRRRALSPVADETREALLLKMQRLTDFRSYDDPEALRLELDRLVIAYRDRLTAQQQASWERLRASLDQGQRVESYLDEARGLLADYPPVLALFDRHRPGQPVPMRQAVPGTPGQAQPQAKAAGREQRYANIHFPSKVLVSQQNVPLVVHLARLRAEVGAKTVAPEAGEVIVTLFAEGFRVVAVAGGDAVKGGDRSRCVQIGVGKDAEPVVFFLTPTSPGVKQLSVELHQYGRNLLSVPFQCVVLPVGTAIKQVTSAPPAALATLATGKAGAARAPELELRIMLSGDRRALQFTLHAPASGDYNFMNAGRVSLTGEPQQHLRPVLDRLSALARQSAESRGQEGLKRGMREIADIGQNLYADLFPPELKREYARFRERYAGCNLLITTDEPWIPWELVRPYQSDERGNILFDDGFLCERFKVARWLAGRGAPERLIVRRGVWVAPPDNLQAVRAESTFFGDLHRKRWQVSFAGPLTSVGDVEKHLEAGDVQLFHFACHGNFNTEDPNESRLKLADDFLRPSQIAGKRADGVRRARPLVFLNACHSGRTGAGLTQLGGWAQRYIEAGASIFVGTLWEINDKLAATFAQEFYGRLLGLEGRQRQPLGQAFHEARLAVRALDPSNSTWLSYVLFGDPNGEVLLDGQEAAP